MIVLILQTALLLLVAFVIGCLLGAVLRSMSAGANEPATATAPVMPAPAPVAVRPSEPVVAPAPKPAKASPKPKRKPAAAAKSKAPGKTAVAPTAELKPPKAGTEVDNLKLIKGVGLQNEARLNALGVIHFDQIAKWKKADVTAWGERLAFPGRIEREEWVSQAKVLAKGGSTEFASRVRRGTVATSKGQGKVGDLGTKPRVLSAPRKAGPDDLTRIDGIGSALEKRLFGVGIYHFDQIAKLTDRQAKWVGIAVGFPGRVERENWIGEAKVLAEGGTPKPARTSKTSTDRKPRRSSKKT